MRSHGIVEDLAYVLHRSDWSESSVIAELFTQAHGRLTVVAKGARKPSSNFRPVLLPMQPLRIRCSGHSEVRVLKSVEWLGGHLMPRGEALLAAYYMGELVMRLVAREDPHADLFAHFGKALRSLALSDAALISATLRAFELLVLQSLGSLARLDQEAYGQSPVKSDALYVLTPDAGLLLAQNGASAQPEAAHSLLGRQWQALQLPLDTPDNWEALLAVCVSQVGLRKALRHVLDYHCGDRPLRTRTLMHDLQSL